MLKNSLDKGSAEINKNEIKMNKKIDLFVNFYQLCFI